MSEETFEGSDEFFREVGYAVLGRAMDLRDTFKQTGDEEAREMSEELKETGKEILEKYE